jgi:NADPH:quinone reductase-like Zn-dependent oxidoreductase
MKAVVQEAYGSADVLAIREVDRPVPGDDQVLVRVHAVGVSPAVWHLMTGEPRLVRLMGFGLRAPKQQVPGFDVAGVVEAVGANVTRFEPGDEVFGVGPGGYAEFVLVREDRCQSKPSHLSFEAAAAAGDSAVTALQALRDAGRLQAGQRVLIIGAGGGVGTFAVQIAVAMGASVTGVCSTGKVDLVRSLGADDVIDYTTDDPVDGSRTWDLILDCAGNRRLSHLRRALTSTGTLVIVGGEEGGRWFGGLGRNLRAAVRSLFSRQRLVSLFTTVRSDDVAHVAALLDDGSVVPVVDRTWLLEEVADAIRHVQSGHATGKTVLQVDVATQPRDEVGRSTASTSG